MKLIRVKCRRQGDGYEGDSYLAVTFATHIAHAEQLCREAFADRGFTSFEAEEPVEGPFDNVQPQVIYEKRRLRAASIDEICRVAMWTPL